jgi:hypothetical protein
MHVIEEGGSEEVKKVKKGGRFVRDIFFTVG